jgi:hypothetical protein
MRLCNRSLGRSLSTLVAILAVAIAPAALHAQGPVRLGLGGGFTLPVGDLGESTYGGINLQASLTYDPPRLPVGFEASATYHNITAKEKSARSSHVMALNGGITIPIAGTLGEPYLMAGIGYYNTQGPTTGPVDAERDFGGYGGVGIRFKADRMQFHMRAGFHEIFAGKDVNGRTRSRELIPISFTIVL